MRNPKALLQKLLFSSSQYRIFPLGYHPSPPYSLTRVQTYVEVYMKWKKDPNYDSIDSIHRSLELKPVIAVKNFFISSSSSSSSHENYSIPISAISKKGLDFGISIKVARFLRNYPSFFEEFKGPLHDLPWFRLTDEAIALDKEERMVYQEFKDDIIERLKKLILMSGRRQMLPLKVIKGLRWNLGLPDEFFKDPLDFIGSNKCFEIVDIEDGLKGLAVSHDGKGDKILSTMQKNAMKRGVYDGGADEAIEFPLYPSKGLRLKQKIKVWLAEFQKLPYVSPYEDPSFLNPDSDVSEKRLVGLLHELLCLFVENAAERKTLFCLKKPLMLPQKVHKAFERHPHMFYLSLKNKTCTAILKEAYCDNSSIDPHPLAKVRKSYIALMKESACILRNRRMNNSSIKASYEENVCSEDLDCEDDERSHLTEA